MEKYQELLCNSVSHRRMPEKRHSPHSGIVEVREEKSGRGEKDENAKE